MEGGSQLVLLVWRTGLLSIQGYEDGLPRLQLQGAALHATGTSTYSCSSCTTFRQVAADNSPYFWAGGRISSDKGTVTWENGQREGIRKGQHPWSFTGSRGQQPDGGRGSENCLAVLNNFYNVSSSSCGGIDRGLAEALQRSVGRGAYCLFGDVNS